MDNDHSTTISGQKNDASTTPGSFEALVRTELETLGKNKEGDAQLDVAKGVKPGPYSEPFVRFTPRDLTGLALSGGGIRSATFNLGLLQGLASLRLLGMFDYLSTVSGGGYIGSWWRAFLWRRWRGDDTRFPCAVSAPSVPPVDPAPEAPEVRHLRRFSNFLSPRVGFFEADTWRIVSSIVTGLIASLLVTLLVVASVLLSWATLVGVFGGASLSRAFGGDQRLFGGVALLAATVILHACLESRWSGRQQLPLSARLSNVAAAIAISALAVSGAMLLPWPLPDQASPYPGWTWEPLDLDVVSLQKAGRTCLPAAIWLLAAAAVVILRLLLNRLRKYTATWLGPNTERLARVAVRMMRSAIVWLGLALVWNAARLAASESPWHHVGELVAGSVTASTVFSLVRKFYDAATETNTRPVSKSKGRLLVPLSYLAVGLFAIATATAAIGAHGAAKFLPQTSGAAVPFLCVVAALGVLLFLLDPRRTALHEFYRARICRAYLGATNERPDTAMCTEEQVGDDIDLDSQLLHGESQSPIHLVCSAANDLAGDPLVTFSRGARSAVLSPLGLSIGDAFAEVPRLNGGRVTYSQAVTASAAAFNSNMGAKSMALGSAVTFLMTALNMRLGLWVEVRPEWPRPAKRAGLGGRAWKWLAGANARSQHALSRTFPGNVLIREMLGRTYATISSDGGVVHLSDGGHFENLALYELIRRHCRYVVVSDCGQDPSSAFEDFGNAQRKIREDFGVEIEIDLDPLRLDDAGHSRQHLAVGTIHYDGVKGYDKGILLYFKPTLTGDEPADVVHYRSSHTRFPHESTGDQFYDEAQWESYRRLGEHAARDALRFLESDQDRKAHVVFPRTYFAWHPSPPGFADRVAEAGRRWTAFVQRLHDGTPDTLTRQLFKELSKAGRGTEQIVGWLEEYLMLMSEWAACGGWAAVANHPLTTDWRNWVARWTSTDSFKEWWPVLKSMCPRSVADFVTGLHPPEDGGRFRFGGPSVRQAQRAKMRPKYTYTIVPARGKSAHQPFHVITLAVDVSVDAVSWSEDLAKPWTQRDFVAAPGYWGAGYGTAFLWALRAHFDGHGGTGVGLPHRTFKVTISGVSRSDAASRRELTDLLGFYRRLGFVLKNPPYREKNPPYRERCTLEWA